MSKKQMIRRRGLSAFLAMAMCFGLLPATAWAAEEGVAIDASNFPNKTFRNYIQKVFDKDNNDFFSADEIAAVTELTFQYPDDPNTGVAGITSLKGKMDEISRIQGRQHTRCSENIRRFR